MEKLAKGQWSKEQAWAWYKKQPWIRGFSGYPSICVNRIAMWQAYNHKEVFEQIDYEFSLAESIGLNAVRAIVQFEVWCFEHDSFMSNFEEYLTLAAKHGIKVMVCLGNDCTVAKSRFKPAVFGEQKVDWGYHSGIKKGQHAGDFTEAGYQLLDDPQYVESYYQMVDELAKKYGKDDRIQIWNVWNEIGNSNRGEMSVVHMEKFFEILRANEVQQPCTADCWSYWHEDKHPRPAEKRALELSDIITFHFYGSYEDTLLLIERLQTEYDRPLINNEWLNRITGNSVQLMFPLFYQQRIGSYHWGLMQGYSQTFEPWDSYYVRQKKGEWWLDLTRWQHDLYRYNGQPYDPAEINVIKRFTNFADIRDGIKKDEK